MGNSLKRKASKQLRECADLRLYTRLDGSCEWMESKLKIITPELIMTWLPLLGCAFGALRAAGTVLRAGEMAGDISFLAHPFNLARISLGQGSLSWSAQWAPATINGRNGRSSAKIGAGLRVALAQCAPTWPDDLAAPLRTFAGKMEQDGGRLFAVCHMRAPPKRANSARCPSAAI